MLFDDILIYWDALLLAEMYKNNEAAHSLTTKWNVIHQLTTDSSWSYSLDSLCKVLVLHLP